MRKFIGLTGNFGCGKSTVATMFEELGAAIIDADDFVRLTNFFQNRQQALK